MKKIYLASFVILLISSSNIDAQCSKTIAKRNSAFFSESDFPKKNCGNVLYYDFSKGVFIYKNTSVKKLSEVKASYRKEFRVAVMNINRYNYNIEIALDNISFGSEQPLLFQKLFTGEGGFVTDLIGKMKVQESDNVKQEIAAQKDPLIARLKSFLNEYYALLESQASAYDYSPPEPGLPKSSRIDTDFTYYANKLLSLKIDYIERINKLSADLSASDVQLKKVEAELQKNKCDTIRKEIENILNKKKSLEDSKKNLEDLWKMVTTITNKDLLKLTHFQKNYIKEHFMYVSPPVYPEGNMLRIGLKFSPSDSSEAKRLNIMPLRNDSLSVDIFVKNKVYLSFSSGPFAGIGGSLWNDVYGWVPQKDETGYVDDTTTYKLVDAGSSKGMTGIAAFANVSLKFCELFGMSLSPGVGVSIESDPRPVYLMGLSLNFGKRQVLSLAGGFLYTYADRLNTALYPDWESTSYDSVGPISYAREPAKGGFISLTYTLYTLDKQGGVKSGSKR